MNFQLRNKFSMFQKPIFQEPKEANKRDFYEKKFNLCSFRDEYLEINTYGRY